jgi:hypothetical protein
LGEPIGGFRLSEYMHGCGLRRVEGKLDKLACLLFSVRAAVTRGNSYRFAFIAVHRKRLDV